MTRSTTRSTTTTAATAYAVTHNHNHNHNGDGDGEEDGPPLVFGDYAMHTHSNYTARYRRRKQYAEERATEKETATARSPIDNNSSRSAFEDRTARTDENEDHGNGGLSEAVQAAYSSYAIAAQAEKKKSAAARLAREKAIRQETARRRRMAQRKQRTAAREEEQRRINALEQRRDQKQRYIKYLKSQFISDRNKARKQKQKQRSTATKNKNKNKNKRNRNGGDVGVEIWVNDPPTQTQKRKQKQKQKQPQQQTQKNACVSPTARLRLQRTASSRPSTKKNTRRKWGGFHVVSETEKAASKIEDDTDTRNPSEEIHGGFGEAKSPSHSGIPEYNCENELRTTITLDEDSLDMDTNDIDTSGEVPPPPSMGNRASPKTVKKQPKHRRSVTKNDDSAAATPSEAKGAFVSEFELGKIQMTEARALLRQMRRQMKRDEKKQETVQQNPSVSTLRANAVAVEWKVNHVNHVNKSIEALNLPSPRRVRDSATNLSVSLDSIQENISVPEQVGIVDNKPTAEIVSSVERADHSTSSDGFVELEKAAKMQTSELPTMKPNIPHSKVWELTLNHKPSALFESLDLDLSVRESIATVDDLANISVAKAKTRETFLAPAYDGNMAGAGFVAGHGKGSHKRRSFAPKTTSYAKKQSKTKKKLAAAHARMQKKEASLQRKIVAKQSAHSDKKLRSRPRWGKGRESPGMQERRRNIERKKEFQAKQKARRDLERENARRRRCEKMMQHREAENLTAYPAEREEPCIFTAPEQMMATRPYKETQNHMSPEQMPNARIASPSTASTKSSVVRAQTGFSMEEMALQESLQRLDARLETHIRERESRSRFRRQGPRDIHNISTYGHGDDARSVTSTMTAVTAPEARRQSTQVAQDMLHARINTIPERMHATEKISRGPPSVMSAIPAPRSYQYRGQYSKTVHTYGSPPSESTTNTDFDSKGPLNIQNESRWYCPPQPNTAQNFHGEAWSAQEKAFQAPSAARPRPADSKQKQRKPKLAASVINPGQNIKNMRNRLNTKGVLHGKTNVSECKGDQKKGQAPRVVTTGMLHLLLSK